MKPFKPNTKLPRGGKLLRPTITKETGGWTSLTYDAKVERLGLTWYRVQGGFSGKGYREDWVADLPSGCLSVSDYNWRDTSFPTNYGSFDKAVRELTKEALRRATSHLEEAVRNFTRAEDAVLVLTTAVRRIPK
jgi:hypothetical protein